jgi:hypothetical protein
MNDNSSESIDKEIKIVDSFDQLSFLMQHLVKLVFCVAEFFKE